MIAHYFYQPAGWIVQYRRLEWPRWTTVGIYPSRDAAEEVYNRLWA